MMSTNNLNNLFKELISRGECEDVEFKQEAVKADNIAETICAFANKKGGYILVGIEDKTKNIVGIKDNEMLLQKFGNANRDRVNPMAELEYELADYKNMKILAAYVKAGNTLYTTHKTRQIYIRTGNSNSPADVDAMIKILNDRGKLYFEDLPGNIAIYDDLDIEKIHQYLKQNKDKGAPETAKSVFKRISNYLISTQKTPLRDPIKVLTSMGLLKDNKPTVAAILLFGTNPQRFFPEYYIDISKLKTIEVGNDNEGRMLYEESIVKHESITGSLADLISKSFKFIMEEANSFELLRDAIWEAIINAVVHRDYCIQGFIGIKVWDDRIEIHSPGGLAMGRTINDLLTNTTSIARNPRIARILSEIGFGESRCKGINRIREDARSKAETEAIFSEDSFNFKVTLNLWKESEPLDTEDFNDTIGVNHEN